MKYLKIFIILIISVLILSSCSFEKGYIFFNSEPIQNEKFLNHNKVFNIGENVYYLFIAPKKINNEFIRVQVFKMAEDNPLGDIDVIRTKDYRLMLNERYYHTNYFTIHEQGRYIMQIFSHADLLHPLAYNDFYIK